ncbi:M50 family metallopeptidase [Candidatus Roseilinea sp. NK_OTU-006]|jgi:regulator of sigma E protease|uniref:M50 family metallopeptidase n=1 Tax=Candidatus Roseilinea sp. NK_OTU-006 TaxID=2704250 RepID=UPI00145C5139|nr:M50 family metallopeptidase [Candidatus Roseilinea sp. NK_OTU-006]
MDLFNSILVGLPVFILLLGPLMLIHELGHFLLAKKAGIRVEEFGMGLPPRAARLFKRGETEYTLNWLPFGAFVRMTGEEDPSDPRSFAAQPKRWRLATLAAGPFMNFLGGFVILTLAYLFFATQPTEFQYRINSVMAGSPAERLGLQPGDVILAVNGADMTQRISPAHHEQPAANALRMQTQKAIGKDITVVVQRTIKGEAQPRQVTLTGHIPANANPNAPLGVSLSFNVTKSERATHSIPDAIAAATDDIASIFLALARLPGELINQNIPLEQARPVGIVGITSIGVSLVDERTTETQGLLPFLRFAGFISIMIGLTNLLPIPALDGGRILFILIEVIRGKRVDPQRERWAHAVGMIILLSLSAVIVVMDIAQPITIR